MRLAALGIGGAGSRVVDALYQTNAAQAGTFLTQAHAVDTDRASLAELEALPEQHRHGFGGTETGGTGTDGDRAAATAAITADLHATRRAVDPAITSDADAILLAAGLGGGTGSGATPHLAQALSEIYDRPIYVLALLPGEHSPSAAANTIRGLENLRSVTDAQLMFDTARRLGTDESIEDRATAINQEIVTNLAMLCGAGETDTAGTVGETVADTSDLIATLTGSTVLGAARTELTSAETDTGSLLNRLRSIVSERTEETVDTVAAIKAIETTTRRALYSNLTAECARETASQALLLVAGPPAWLNRDAIMDNRAHLAETIGSRTIRGGDLPRPSDTQLTVIVVLSGVTDVSPVQTLHERLT